MNQDPLREGDGSDPKRRVAVEMLSFSMTCVADLYGGHAIGRDQAAGATLAVAITELVALYGKAAARKEVEDWVKRVFDNPDRFRGAKP